MPRLAESARIYEALRAKCTARLAELSQYRDATAREELAYMTRWTFTSHLLYRLEEIHPDFDSTNEALELLELCAEIAQADAERWKKDERSSPSTHAIEHAAASEANLVCEWLVEPKSRKVPFARVGQRRVLDESTWRSVKKGLGRVSRADPIPLARLAKTLAAGGTERVYLLHPESHAASLEMDVAMMTMRPEDGAPHYHPPVPAICAGLKGEFFGRIAHLG